MTNWPKVFDVSGNVPLRDQLLTHGIDPAVVPPFEALVLNTLQQLLDAVIDIREPLR